jgi:hypothetical protein
MRMHFSRGNGFNVQYISTYQVKWSDKEVENSREENSREVGNQETNITKI